MNSSTRQKSEEQLTSTEERILDAAETLFARKGWDGTSVRDITTEAGCNVAAVNYHFGGKDALYRAVFVRFARELWESHRLRLLEEVATNGEPTTLEGSLALFVRTFVTNKGSAHRQRRLDALVDREIRSQRLPPEVFFQEMVQPVREVVLDILAKFAPPMDRVAAELCLMSFVGEVMGLRRRRGIRAQANMDPLKDVDDEQLLRHIVCYSAAGIRACAQTQFDQQER